MIKFILLTLFLNIYLLQHVGSSSLTRDWTQSMESKPLDCQWSPYATNLKLLVKNFFSLPKMTLNSKWKNTMTNQKRLQKKGKSFLFQYLEQFFSQLFEQDALRFHSAAEPGKSWGDLWITRDTALLAMWQIKGRMPLI